MPGSLRQVVLLGSLHSLWPVSCPGMCAEEAEGPGCTPGIDKLFSYRITRLTRLCGDNRSLLLSQRCGPDMPLGPAMGKQQVQPGTKRKVGELHCNVRSSTHVPKDLTGTFHGSSPRQREVSGYITPATPCQPIHPISLPWQGGVCSTDLLRTQV